MQNDDDALFKTVTEELFTAVIGDVLDKMGYHRQFLPPDIKPLNPTEKLVGRALPVLEADYPSPGLKGPLSGMPFGLMLEALDSLKSGEIYVATGTALAYAMWGGLMSIRALHLGAVGTILDGYVRDTGEIARMGFPVFCRGAYAQDQAGRGKVIDFSCPVEIGGVGIAPGDLMIGDNEGVLVVPREAEDEAVRRALEKAKTENEVAKAIQGGMSASAAFAEYGVM